MNKSCYSLVWLFRKFKRKILKKPIEIKKYASKILIDNKAVNDFISTQIKTGKPFMVGRFGNVELSAMVNIEMKRGKINRNKVMYHLVNNAGFFPSQVELLNDFTNIMFDSCKEVDVLGVWYNNMEDYIIEHYCSQCTLTHLTGIEPWYVENPWTAVLKGRKVLVIHPFEETIKKQYQKREFLFPGTEILPEFEKLYTLKAVQTIGGGEDKRFCSWFEALDWMYREAMKFDFDIAIIGCGAYGFPLAARIKSEGKRQAIHMGGATQLLFGIKGRRWDEHPIIGKLYNEYWTRPNQSERPQNSEMIENGCYW